MLKVEVYLLDLKLCMYHCQSEVVWMGFSRGSTVGKSIEQHSLEELAHVEGVTTSDDYFIISRIL